MLNFDWRWRWSGWFLGAWGAFCLAWAGWALSHWQAQTLESLERLSRFIVLLDPSQPIETREQIQQTLRQDSRLAAVRVLSFAEVWQDLAQALSFPREASEGQEAFSLPIVLEIQLSSQAYLEAEALQAHWQGKHGIQAIWGEVQTLQSLASTWKYGSFLGIFSLIGGGAIWGLFLGLWLRIRWESQASERQLLRLSGAPLSSIRLPFLREAGIIWGICLIVGESGAFVLAKVWLSWVPVSSTEVFGGILSLHRAWEAWLYFGLPTLGAGGFVLGQVFSWCAREAR